jgi:M6 family metalloprotease-like protein
MKPRAFAVAFLIALHAVAQDPPSRGLSEFKTVETAATTQIARRAARISGQSGYLGVALDGESKNRLVVAHVAPDSPAAKADIQPGDVILLIDGQGVEDARDFSDVIQGQEPGTTVRLTIERKGKSRDTTVTIAATSRPMGTQTQGLVLGVRIGEPREEEGAPITRVTAGSAADKAGVRVGDELLKIDGVPISTQQSLSDSLSVKQPGDTVSLLVRRGDRELELKAQLEAENRDGGDRSFFRGGSYWRKEAFRLAVVGIEYPDAKRNEKVAAADWEESFFSKGTYRGKNNATGQPVFGSLHDYYWEQSHGALRVEGRMFDWVLVSKNRMDYAPGTGTGTRTQNALLTEALDRLIEREGKDALKDFDGIFFMYAGTRPNVNRGNLYWPHRSSVTYAGKRWPFFIMAEGGARMANISVACHEFGHMLGLPDLYARPENPGSEGLGRWCAMATEARNGRPQHFSAWCKEQLGWIKPVAIDPRVPQKLILAPVNDSAKECFKVLIRLDGSEYLLLENRRRKGFDESLPAEGLLIWRVVGNRPILEESHGVEGPSGPGVHLSSVPYPSGANNAYTPYTTPSSRSQLGGGLPVWITNITRHADGRISFYVGFEFH